MKVKMTSLKFTASGAAALALALLTNPSQAATTIFSEDWQGANPGNDYRLQATDDGGFTDWDFAGNNVFMFRHSPSNGIPQDGLSPNHAVQFEWSDSYASYDTTHSWSSTDDFNVSFNATEMNWSNASERFIRVRIKETVSGDRLWQGDVQLAQYDAAHDGNGDSWSGAQTFNLNFSAADFGTVFETVGGTEGSLITFEVGGTRRDLVDNSFYAGENRGSYIDNINFTVDAIPEPASMAVVALGGFALVLRRRRK